MDDGETELSAYEMRERRFVRRMQPSLRAIATFIGAFAACSLPRCRRAKQCLGCHPAEEIGSSHWKNFPPCISDDAKQAAFNAGTLRLAALEEQEALAAGYDAATLDEVQAAWDRAIRESDDWD